MRMLLPYINEWFLGKQDYLSVFSSTDSRVEGWLKAELIMLFTGLLKDGRISDFRREYSVHLPEKRGRKQIDFWVKMGDEEHLCELKAMCISQAAGTPRNLMFYFRGDNVGLLKDFRKLDSLDFENRWLLGFVYPTPRSDELQEAILSLPSELMHWKIVTDPRDYPQYLFVSLWRG